MTHELSELVSTWQTSSAKKQSKRFQLCTSYGLCQLYCSLNAAANNILTNEHGCVPTKLYLQKQAVSQIGLQAQVGHSLA